METRNFCQSCSMPLDKPEFLGTEKDGSKNHEYCIYCYKNGAFTNPDMTLGEMEAHIKKQMEKMKMDASIVNKAENILPKLKRWRVKTF